MFKYLRFLVGHILVLITTIGVLAGGHWMWTGFLAALLSCVVGDALLGDDIAEPTYNHPNIFLFTMWVALPLLVIMSFAAGWMLSKGDPFGAGLWFQSLTGWNLFAARAATGGLDWLGAALSVGLLYALSGTDIGHELTHRTYDKPSLMIGRWMLAFSWDAQFSVEHVYGHHDRVCTPRDPATARRGEFFYSFLLRSFFGQLASAWELEATRLRKNDFLVWSWRNRVLRGYLMSITITAGFYVLAGTTGALFFTAVALYGKSVLEVVNYFEHYGLVREEGKPVQPYHSWNCNRLMSNIILHNVTRHSNHHAQADIPFWKLRAYTEQPTMPYGYLTSLAIVYFAPWTFRRLMTPHLLDWDRRFANAAERELAARANESSGLAALMAAGR